LIYNIFVIIIKIIILILQNEKTSSIRKFRLKSNQLKFSNSTYSESINKTTIKR